MKVFAGGQGQSPKMFGRVAFTLLVTHILDTADCSVPMQLLAGHLESGITLSEEENLMICNGEEGPPAASYVQRDSTKGYACCAAVWYSASHYVTCPGFLCLTPLISDLLSTKIGGIVNCSCSTCE